MKNYSLIVLIFLIVSCDIFFQEDNKVYKVYYYSTKSDTGEVPVDTKKYNAGDEVTVKDNTGNLQLENFRFLSWNTSELLNGKTYYPGEKISVKDKDIKLYANWEEIPYYTVKFKFSNSEIIDREELVKEGKKVSKPENHIINDDYIDGWFIDSNYINEWDFEKQIINKDLTLYARWVPLPTYNVQFDSNGGSIVASQSVKKHKYISEPIPPKKSGFIFGGWFKDPNFSLKWDFFVNNVEHDLKLYAQWSVAPIHSVIFELNGGYSDTYNQNVLHGDHVIEPTNPTKNGYNFAGWYSNSELTSLWLFNHYSVQRDIVLYAKWSELPVYMVTFKDYPELNQNVTEGFKINKPEDPIRSNQYFIGWYKDYSLKNLWDFNNDLVTRNITLYHSWKYKPRYKVIFDRMDGSQVYSSYAYEGNTISEPRDPVWGERPFLGWYKDKNFNLLWDFQKDTLADNITLYAKWGAIPPKIDIFSNGSNLDGLGNKCYFFSTYNGNSDINEYKIKNNGEEDLIIDGNILKEPSSSQGLIDDYIILKPLKLLLKPGEETTFSITFSPNTTADSEILIKINSNSGFNKSSYIIKAIGSVNERPFIESSLNSFIRNGDNEIKVRVKDPDDSDLNYKWYVDNLLYAEGKNRSTISLNKSVDVNNIDVRVEISDRYTTITTSESYMYPFSYDLNGATYGQLHKSDDEPILVAEGSTLKAASLKKDAVKPGYAFLCWNSKPDGTGIDYYEDDYIRLNGEFNKLYIKWQTGCRVIYDLEGYWPASITENKTIYNIGDEVKINRFSNKYPIKEGYILQGLNTKKDGSGKTFYLFIDSGIYEENNKAIIDENHIILYPHFIKIEDLTVGDIGPSRGFIIYDDLVDGIDDIINKRYIEAFQQRMLGSYKWGVDDIFTGITKASIGSGLENTLQIIEHESSKNNAAHAAYSYEFDNRDFDGVVYNDYFLPSIDELVLFHDIMVEKGIKISMYNDRYWSSTIESEIVRGINSNIISGELTNTKDFSYKVRPFRMW